MGQLRYDGKAYTEGLRSWAKKSEDYARPHVIVRIGKEKCFHTVVGQIQNPKEVTSVV